MVWKPFELVQTALNHILVSASSCVHSSSATADISRYSEAIHTAHLRAIIAMSTMQIGYVAADWKRTLAIPSPKKFKTRVEPSSHLVVKGTSSTATDMVGLDE